MEGPDGLGAGAAEHGVDELADLLLGLPGSEGGSAVAVDFKGFLDAVGEGGKAIVECVGGVTIIVATRAVSGDAGRGERGGADGVGEKPKPVRQRFDCAQLVGEFRAALGITDRIGRARARSGIS